MARLKLLAVTVLIVLFIGSAFGDVIHFKDGRKIEGEIVSQDAKTVTIKTKYGTKSFPLSDIDSIETKKTKDQEYQEQLKKTNPKDADAVMALIVWCNDNGMESASRKHLREIIRLDPNHKEAREMLGYVMHEGKWVTPKEMEAIKKKEEIEKMKADGLVEYKGEWLPAEDVEKLKEGLIKYNDEWVTKQEKERLEKNLLKYEGQWLPKEDVEKMKQGLFKVGEEWVDKKNANRLHADWEDPWVLHSEHIKIRTNLDYDYAQQLLAEGESTYNLVKSLVKTEPKLNDSPLIMYVVSTIEEYNNIGDAIGDEKSSNYPVFYVEESMDDGPISVSYSTGRNEAALRFTKGLVRHMIAECYLRRLDEKGEIPLWFIKGHAAKLERFWHPQYISWSLKSMRSVGGFIKTTQFFDAFNFTEQEIYMGGLVCAYLDSDLNKEIPTKVKEFLTNSITAIGKKKKISNAFAELEKALIKDEKGIRAFMGKH
jgi:hypothetical protein